VFTLGVHYNKLLGLNNKMDSNSKKKKLKRDIMDQHGLTVGTGKLEVNGHPLHTRFMTISAYAGKTGNLDIKGSLIDIRKCGVIPVGYFIQTPDIIHHMEIHATIDPVTKTVNKIEEKLLTFPVRQKKGALTESCVDALGALSHLSGSQLDKSFSKRVAQTIGGPKGCSHMMTLGQLLGSAMMQCFQFMENQEENMHWEEGERVFHRTLSLDGFERENGVVSICGQLTDLYFKPESSDGYLTDTFACQKEVRSKTDICLKKHELLKTELAERSRNLNTLESAAWKVRDDEVSDFAGKNFMSGLSAQFIRQFGGDLSDAPALDTLLNQLPVVVQCLGPLGDQLLMEFRDNPGRFGTGPSGDLCYIWREGGELALANEKYS
jgi:hypothetical protein